MKKRIPTGHGRMTAQVSVVVKTPFYKEFVKAGWVMVSEDESSATFVYACSNRYEGDDESIVHALWGDLPLGMDGDHFNIDWEGSVY